MNNPGLTLRTSAGIAYRTRNPEAPARPIVFVHGAAGNKLVWLSTTRRLGVLLPDRPIFFLDLPGHGESEGPGLRSISAYAKVLSRFCGDLVLSPCDAVGHSMGGAIVLTAALDDPELFSRIAVVGSGYRLPIHPMLLPALKEDYATAIGMVRDWAFADGADAKIVASVLREMTAGDPETAIGDFQACDDFDIKSQVPKLVPPLAVCYGDDDRMTGENRNKALASAVPGARIYRFEGAGHMLMVEKPAETARKLADHLDEH